MLDNILPCWSERPGHQSNESISQQYALLNKAQRTVVKRCL